MKILTTSTEEQVFKVIPRREVEFPSMYLVDKDTNVEELVLADYIYDGIYLEITCLLSLEEKTTYSLRLEDEQGGLLYRDLVYCTDQVEFMKFKTNEDNYIENDKSSENEYVVL